MAEQTALDLNAAGWTDFNCSDCGCLIRCWKPRPGPSGYDVSDGRCITCWFLKQRRDSGELTNAQVAELRDAAVGRRSA